MPSISYAITACNEHVELERLLEQLLECVPETDEIVIQLDSTATEQVRSLAMDYISEGVKVIEFSLNNDFASFKNNLKQHCTKDYIFQIDADEYLSSQLLENIHQILELNPEVELYAVPRINTVEGLTQEHIDQWRWYVNNNGWVNYPDYQHRIFKNIDRIKWRNKVHEHIIGARTASPIPEGYDLIHPKTIERQEKQNNYYGTIS